MRVGIHEQYTGSQATTFGHTMAKFPLSEVTREFAGQPITAQNLIPKMVAACQPAWAQGKTVAWSFKPMPSDVASGAWKPFIQQLAHFIQDNALQSKVILVIWHEPENDVPKYFKNAADFVELFNSVHDWLIEVDSSIVTSHAALGYYYRNVTAATAARWVTKATVHSIDIYSGKSFPLSMTLGTSQAFRTWKESRPPGAPWGVSERGWIADSVQSSQRVAAIDAEALYLAALPPAEQPDFYIVWNTPGTENNPYIVLDEAGRAAVNRLFVRVTSLVCPVCNGSGLVRPGQTYVIVR